MKRIAFKMHVHRGKEGEYKRRHDAIWPELKTLLSHSGIRDYSIFLDESTNDLVGVLTIDDPDKMSRLPAEPVMQRWWSYMRDIMDANPDHSPVSEPLTEVFYMP